MNVQKVIIHTLDQNKRIRLISDFPVDLGKESGVAKYIENFVKSFLKSPQVCKGKLHASSEYLKYIGTQFDFIPLSKTIATPWFDFVQTNETGSTSTLIIAQVDVGDYISLVAVELMSKQGYINITEVGDDIENNLVHFQGILPNSFSSVRNGFFINLTTGETRIKYKDEMYRDFLETHLDCDIVANTKMSYEVVDSLIHYISEKRDETPLENSIKGKQVINESTEFYQEIEPLQVLKEVFETLDDDETNVIESSFEEHHIHDLIDLRHMKRTQMSKKQRIKTEYGVEITIPLLDLDVHHVLEIKKDDTGNATIILKNIGKII